MRQRKQISGGERGGGFTVLYSLSNTPIHINPPIHLCLFEENQIQRDKAGDTVGRESGETSAFQLTTASQLSIDAQARKRIHSQR